MVAGQAAAPIDLDDSVTPPDLLSTTASIAYELDSKDEWLLREVASARFASPFCERQPDKVVVEFLLWVQSYAFTASRMPA